MYKHMNNPHLNPFLRFVETPVESGGGNDGKELGFPKDTPVDSMTDAEKAAYWKNQSKVQQQKFEAEERRAKAYEKFGSVDDLQAAADAAEQARLAALDDTQRAIEAAREEGRAEASAAHGDKHLAAAVTGMLIAHTKGASETFESASARIAGALEFADLTKFVSDDGVLDAEKVQTFAQSIGSAGGNGDSSNAGWGAQHERDHSGRIPPVPGATGSVAAMEQEAYERMTKKTA